MVSRQKNLPRPHSGTSLQPPPDEEDVWYHGDKLCRDHVQEVLNKWKQIDDEIWAKIVVFERNRRVAKAYARAPVITVNGSDEDFDGFRIGLNGFDSPMKDRRTAECKRHVGHGIKVKMDDAGNVLIKRVSKCNVFVKVVGAEDENAVGSDALHLPNSSLQMEKPVKLFDMKKFQGNLKRELRRAYPDRRRLESQCLSAVAFVKDERELLECPIWILIINVVAIEMLKSKLPPTERMLDIKDRPRIPAPDEDPYSLPGAYRSNMTSGKDVSVQNQAPRYRGDKPPRLPPRENLNHPVGKSNGTLQQADAKDNRQYEDPYYHGLRARVSSFVSKTKTKLKKPQQEEASVAQEKKQNTHSVNIRQHPMWYTRSAENGIDSEFLESPYSKIYGKIAVPRGYVPQNRVMHIGEWD